MKNSIENGTVIQMGYKLKCTTDNAEEYKLFNTIGRPYYSEKEQIDFNQLFCEGGSMNDDINDPQNGSCKGLVLIFKPAYDTPLTGTISPPITEKSINVDVVSSSSSPSVINRPLTPPSSTSSTSLYLNQHQSKSESTLWLRRQVSRIQKELSSKPSTNGEDVTDRPTSSDSIISSATSSPSVHHSLHSANSSPSGLQVSVFPSAPPLTLTQATVLNTDNVHHHNNYSTVASATTPAYVLSSGSMISVATPATADYSSILDSSLPASATTIPSSLPSATFSSTHEAYPDSLVSIAYDDSWLASGMYNTTNNNNNINNNANNSNDSNSHTGRSYSSYDIHQDPISFVSIKDEFLEGIKSPPRTALGISSGEPHLYIDQPFQRQYQQQQQHYHHHHHHSPVISNNHSLSLSSSSSNFYMHSNSTNEQLTGMARVSLEDHDPSSGAYWDNTTNSELVSPQYYQSPVQPTTQSPDIQSHHLHLQQHQRQHHHHYHQVPYPSPVPTAPTRGRPKQNSNYYLDATQLRNKSYSLPGAFDMNYNIANGYNSRGIPHDPNNGNIDFSGYTMAVKKTARDKNNNVAMPSPATTNSMAYQQHIAAQRHLSVSAAATSSSAGKGRRRVSKVHHNQLDGLGGYSNHVCTECGAMESPEWRKGPKGPKTLCNACGLRWAKKTRKEEGLTKKR